MTDLRREALRLAMPWLATAILLAIWELACIVFDIPEINDQLALGAQLTVTAASADGKAVRFPVRVRIDTPVELEYYRNGGILQAVLRKMLAEG